MPSRLLVVTGIASVVLLVLAVVASGATPRKPSWLPPRWYRIGVCETGLRWKWGAQFRQARYGGAFGIFVGTWQTYARAHEPQKPWQASPRLQLAVARRIAARHTLAAWGCYRNYAWVRGAS